MGFFQDDRVYRSGVPITPGDTAASNLALGVNGIYVGGAGNVTVTWQDGSVSTFTAPPVGSLLPIGPLRVNATLTTATLLVALY